MTIQNDSAVAIDYTLKDDDGNVLDSSEGRAPLNYLHGHKNIIVGLEEALIGKVVGDKLDVSIPPEKAYGVQNDNLVIEVDKAQFPEPEKLEIGMQFQMNDGQGGIIVVKIAKVAEDKVTIDGNHDLAGKTLHFAVEVKEIREASEEEISHGHIHGPGGHEH